MMKHKATNKNIQNGFSEVTAHLFVHIEGRFWIERLRNLPRGEDTGVGGGDAVEFLHDSEKV